MIDRSRRLIDAITNFYSRSPRINIPTSVFSDEYENMRINQNISDITSRTLAENEMSFYTYESISSKKIQDELTHLLSI